MSEAKPSNAQTIITGAVSAVLAAGVIWIAQTVWTSIHPREALSVDIISARVAPLPEQFVEGMPDAGCDDIIPFGTDINSIQAHDGRVSACRTVVTQFLNALNHRNFRQVRVEIENRGNAPEENVRVIAPGFDYARLVAVNRPAAEFTHDQPITAGNLAPGDSVEIQIWSAEQYQVPLSQVAVYSNSGRANSHITWGDASTTDENYWLEADIIWLLNAGLAPLLLVLCLFGGVMVLALVSAIVQSVSGKSQTPTPPAAQTAA